MKPVELGNTWISTDFVQSLPGQCFGMSFDMYSTFWELETLGGLVSRLVHPFLGRNVHFQTQ